MNQAPNATPSTTEETPAAPGWVEPELERILDEVLGGLASRPSLRGHRNAYLDCLAGTGRGMDPDASHDRCRRRFLEALSQQEGVTQGIAERLEQQLEALEADLSARI